MARFLLPAAAFLLGVLAWPSSALAQLEVSARLQHTRTLQHEPVVTTIRLRNLTGRDVSVGRGKEVEVYFRIEPRPGYYLEPRAGVELVEPFILGPREEQSMVVDLLRTYDLGATGPYTVRVRLQVGETMLSGRKQYLDVVPGFKLQSMKVPQANSLSDIVDCSLRTLNRNGREHLFLRFDDPGREACLGVYDLGPVIRYGEPKLQLDGRGYLHVLHQSAPTRYTHSIHMDNGQPLSSTFHTKGNSPVRLGAGENSSLQVLGALPYEGDLSVQFPKLPEASPFR